MAELAAKSAGAQFLVGQAASKLGVTAASSLGASAGPLGLFPPLIAAAPIFNAMFGPRETPETVVRRLARDFLPKKHGELKGDFRRVGGLRDMGERQRAAAELNNNTVNIAEGLAFLNRKGVTPERATSLGLEKTVAALIPGARKIVVGGGRGGEMEAGVRLGGIPGNRPNRRQAALAGNRRRTGK